MICNLCWGGGHPRRKLTFVRESGSRGSSDHREAGQDPSVGREEA